MKPLVALALPGRRPASTDTDALVYGLCCKAVRSQKYDVTPAVCWKSVITVTFNTLWCGFRNQDKAARAAPDGRPLAYFAMLHDDVVPDAGWLDVLIGILEKNPDVDLVSAVVPIKDDRGLTSTAVDGVTGDDWGPRRLTMAEVCALPPTFSAADVGGELLLNSGCWVARFDAPWVPKVCFRQQDRIVELASGDVAPQTMTEDWDFTRQVRAAGGKVLATRAVGLYHEETRFQNQTPWGMWATDEEFTPGYKLPANVEGWLDPIEAAGLSRLVEGKRVLEIGSYCGLSTICMARAAAHVHAVDYFDGRGTPNPKDTLIDFQANLEAHGVADKVAVTVGSAAQVPADAGPFDVVFIDGAHDLESVRADVAHARRLAPNAVLAFHDYRQYPGEFDGRWDPGVTHVVDELCRAGGQMLARHYTVAVVKPPAA